MPELGIVFAPWTLPGMKVIYSRGFLTLIVSVALALLLDWRLADPGPWPVTSIVVCTAVGCAWPLHGAVPEIRRLHEENERAREAFLRSRRRR